MMRLLVCGTAVLVLFAVMSRPSAPRRCNGPVETLFTSCQK